MKMTNKTKFNKTGAGDRERRIKAKRKRTKRERRLRAEARLAGGAENTRKDNR